MKNFYYKKIFAAVVILFTTCVPGFADDHKGRLQIGTGFLYERGMDLTVAYEHETRYHNAWEYFGNVYLNGTNALRAATCARSRSGTTTTRGAWA